MGFDSDVAKKIKQLESYNEKSRSRDHGYTIADVYGSYMLLPGLKGFWPTSSAGDNWALCDVSGQGRHMTLAGTPTPSYNYLTNGLPFTTMNTGSYFRRDSELGTSITGGLTLLSWIFVTTNTVQVILKQGSYELYMDGSVLFRMNGTVDTGVAASFNQWTFAVARYTPGSEIKLWSNTNIAVRTSGVPASINSNSNPLYFSSWFGNFSQTLTAICSYPVPDSAINRLFNVSRGFFGV